MGQRRKNSLSALGEFGLIDQIKKQSKISASVLEGIGDDTAVVSLNKTHYMLLTTDMLVEGVHFKKNTKPHSIGHKALACNISDIAAMGGVPKYALISLGVPKTTTPSKLKAIYSGINALARKYDVSVVGGDTVKASKLTINVTLVGEVKKKDLVLRRGARAGNQIFVTGPLGQSIKEHHLKFTPRVKEAQFLVKQCKPTAMIDISDGLASDLNHILKSSKVGANLFEDQIPRRGRATLKQALGDGEDFELLFTVPKTKMNKLKNKNGMKFYHIGEVIKKSNKKYTQGFTHF